MSECFDLYFYITPRRNSREFVDLICNYFIQGGYKYDDTLPCGYWLDSKESCFRGPFSEALRALSAENGSICLRSNIYSVPVSDSDETIIQDRFTINISIKPDSSKWQNYPGYIHIWISTLYILNGELKPEFVLEIDKISKGLWQHLHPLYGCGGKEYWVDYSPKLSEITTSFGLPDIFPMNFFGKHLVDFIGEESLKSCGADIIQRFPDGSYMIWPSRDPYYGDKIQRIRKIKENLGIKNKI